MAKYRKKPVVVEAWRWTFPDESDARSALPAWLQEAMHKRGVGSVRFVHQDGREVLDSRVEVGTLTGVVYARQGDWIVRGVNGELYPCKPDIFEKTYEAV